MKSVRHNLFLLMLFFSGFAEASINFSSSGSELEVETTSDQLILEKSLDGVSGRIILPGSGSNVVQGATINFTNGKLQTPDYEAKIKGAFDATGADKLLLSGGGSLCIPRQAEFLTLEISGTGNEIFCGSTFSSALTLTNASAQVSLSLEVPLNQDLTLNGGTADLADKLVLDGSIVVGPTGTINGAGHALVLQPQGYNWTTTVNLNQIDPLELRNTVSLSGMWIIGGENQTSKIDGNGNILDLSLGGTIWIKSGHGLELYNTQLLGLGHDKGTILFEDINATLTVVGSTLRLDNDYTVSMGQLYFARDNSVIATGAHTLSFVGSGKYTIDGTNLVAQRDNWSLGRNVSPKDHDGTNAFFINDGRLNSPAELKHTDPLVLDYASNTLTGSDAFSVKRPLIIRGEHASSIVLDGGGNRVVFPKTTDTVITMSVGKSLELRNVVLDGFRPEHVDLTLGGPLLFGDNSTIELADSYTPAFTFTFLGQGKIDGNHHALTFTTQRGVCLENNATVTFKNLGIKGLYSLEETIGQVGNEPYGYSGRNLHQVDDPNGKDESDVEWRPQGDFLLLAPQGGVAELYEYDAEGDTFTELSISMSEQCRHVQWSADGKFLAIGNNPLKIYSFDPVAKDFTQVSSYDPTPYHGNSWNPRTEFSPDGNYLAYAFAGSSGYEVRVLGFNKTTGALSAIAWAYATTPDGDRLMDVSWHKDGEYLAVAGGGSTNQLKIYKFDVAGTSFTKETEETVFSGGNYGYVVGFSAGSDRLAIFEYGSPAELAVYDFNPADASVSEVDRVGGFVYSYNLIISYDGSIIFTTCTENATTFNVHEVVNGSLVELDSVSQSRGSGLSLCDATSRVAWFTNNRGPNPNLNHIRWQTVQGVAGETVTNRFSNLTLAPSSRLVLSDCHIYLDNNYTLTNGMIDVLGDLHFTSTWASFIYSGSSDLCVCKGSRLVFDRGTTFSYDSAGGGSKLVMADETAEVILDSATLLVTSTGMTFSSGTLVLKGDCTLETASTDTTSGLILHDTSRTIVTPGARLNIQGAVANGSS